MEDKLRAIVTRIEASSLSDDAKNRIYETIHDELQKTVLPILYDYLPEDRLMELSNDKSKVTAESYASLIGEAIKDGKAFEEIGKVMEDVLQEVETTLVEGGVI